MKQPKKSSRSTIHKKSFRQSHSSSSIHEIGDEDVRIAVESLLMLKSNGSLKMHSAFPLHSQPIPISSPILSVPPMIRFSTSSFLCMDSPLGIHDTKILHNQSSAQYMSRPDRIQIHPYSPLSPLMHTPLPPLFEPRSTYKPAFPYMIPPGHALR